MQGPRVVRIEAHVLAYLGDYLSAFKAVLKRETEASLRELPSPSTNTQTPLPQKQTPAGRS